MSNIAIKGGDTGTATFTIEAPATSTDRTLTLPDEAGTVLTSASSISGQQATSNTVAFSARAVNVDQAVSNATATKVTFNVENLDSHGYFADSRFTPQVAGWYLIGGAIRFNTNGDYPNDVYTNLYKNGTTFITVSHFQLTSQIFNNSTLPVGTELMYLNGSTDYVELYTYISGSTTTTLSDGTSYATMSTFHGFLVRAD